MYCEVSVGIGCWCTRANIFLNVLTCGNLPVRFTSFAPLQGGIGEFNCPWIYWFSWFSHFHVFLFNCNAFMVGSAFTVVFIIFYDYEPPGKVEGTSGMNAINNLSHQRFSSLILPVWVHFLRRVYVGSRDEQDPQVRMGSR